MAITKFIIVLSSILMVTCQNASQVENSDASNKSTDQLSLGESDFIYWVNSYKVNCTGVGEQLCLLVQKGEKLKPGKWENFYSPIEGFDWEPGNMYQLTVEEEHLPPNEIPADASSIKYILKKVLQKELDPTQRLHDIWALESIDGKAWENKDHERPTMEINLTQQNVMGTDGCNRYQGDIKLITRNTIKFGPLSGTKKACPDMESSNLFNKKMAQVQAYKLNQLKLNLLDGDGNTLMQFKKVD